MHTYRSPAGKRRDHRDQRFLENSSIFRGRSVAIFNADPIRDWNRGRGIIKPVRAEIPPSNYKDVSFVELNREILRKKRVRIRWRKGGAILLWETISPSSKRDPYLARFKRSPFFPQRDTFPRKRIFLLYLLRARELPTLDYFAKKWVPILLALLAEPRSKKCSARRNLRSRARDYRQ